MKKLLTASLLIFLASGGYAQTVPVDGSEPYSFVVARFAAESGDFERALEIINELVRKTPDDPILRYERAVILLDAGETERAMKELRELVAVTPAFYDAQRLIGRLLLDAARNDRALVEEAKKHLEKALELAPDDISTALTLSQILMSQGRYTEAEKLVAATVERAPDNRALNLNYAQILTKLGRTDDAVQFFERVVEADPTYVPAIMPLIDVYQKRSEWKKAADLLQPLVEDESGNADVRRQQGYFYLRAGETEKSRQIFSELASASPEDERNQFFLAESLTDLGEYEKAEAIYRKLLEKQPNDAELLMSFALNLAAQRKLEPAAEAFRSLLAVKDLPPGAVILTKTQLSAIERERENYEAALQYAREAIIGPRGLNSQALNLALDIFRRQKRYAEALDFIRPLADRYKEPALYARVVEFQFRAGKTADATRLAQQQIRQGGNAAAAIGETYLALRRYPDAVAIYEALRQKNPKDVSIGFQLAAAYERSGKIEQAEKLFLELLRDAPDNASILNYLGYMWADRGVNLEKSEEMLRKAVSLDPQNGAYLDSLGWVYFKLGKLDLAEKYLVEAASRMPNDPTIQEHLGDVLARVGKTSKALEAYRSALKLDSEETDEEKLRVKIAEAEKRISVAP